MDLIHISHFVQYLELPALTSLTSLFVSWCSWTTRESRGRSRPAESCFVLMCSLMMLIECVMKIRVCKQLHVFAFFFCWGDEGGVHAPGGILVDFCSIQGTGTTQLYWRVPIIDIGSSTWCQ